MTDPKIQRALISVSDKTGVVEFAKQLTELGIEILSTGGTAKLLAQENIAVQEVSDYTGFPEIMDGRVKTLHPKIHGALLARPGIDDEITQAHNIEPIQLLVVNLYPFEKTIANPDCDLATAIENIDIGGPTMLRAGAKNHQTITVVVDVSDYDQVINDIKQNQATSLDTRFAFAQKVFAHTAHYDTKIAEYLLSKKQKSSDKFPAVFTSEFIKVQDMRYGENPDQQAAFYRSKKITKGSIAHAKQLQGKALSFNNINDADAALECVKSFQDKPSCVIVKHANPCGVAIADTQLTAYEQAFNTDKTSAFGGIIAFNKTLLAETAQKIIDNQFVEVIIAPFISDEAKTILTQKQNVRVLETDEFSENTPGFLDCKRVNGGLLIQEADQLLLDEANLKVVSERKPTEKEYQDLLFAWKVAKFVKSNAIVYVKDNSTIGIGAGQMSRIDSAVIAGLKAKEANLSVENAVMASDAFFPFRDGIDAAAKVGISAIIQPGGSIRDEEVIQAANEAKIAMLFTNIRHFRH